MTGRVVRGATPDDSFDIRFWSSLTPAERFIHTWELSRQLWEFAKGVKFEPGLSRHFASVIRPKN